MRDGVLNCPNCGAPVTGGRCEYCGTIFQKEKHAVMIKVDGHALAKCLYDARGGGGGTGAVQGSYLPNSDAPCIYEWSSKKEI